MQKLSKGYSLIFSVVFNDHLSILFRRGWFLHHPAGNCHREKLQASQHCGVLWQLHTVRQLLVFWPFFPKRRSVIWKLWTRIFAHRANKLWICMEFCGGGSLQDVYHGKNPSSKSLHQSLSTRSLCVMYCRYIQGRQILIITKSHKKPEKPVFIHVFIIAHPLHHTYIHTCTLLFGGT